MLRPLGVVFAAAVYAAAQTGQTADCSATGTNYEWSFNSRNQNPCVIASYLGGACNSGVFNVPPLPSDEYYLGPPAKESANRCICNTVFYSLVAVCSLCQARPFLLWSRYNVNCTMVYPFFPPNIPAGTSVPHYAYLNVTPNDGFDPVGAQAVAGAPESSGIPQFTGSATPTGAPPTSSNNPSSGSSSSRAGPIAGGVVGGVVFIALIAAAAFWWTRRRKARMVQPPQGVTNYTDHSAPTPVSFNSGTTSASPFVGMPSLSPKLYDPSDPSTYPSTPATSAVFTTQEHQPFLHNNSSVGVPYQTHMNSQGRNYTGAPEV